MSLERMSENTMDYFCDRLSEGVQNFYMNPKNMEDFKKWKKGRTNDIHRSERSNDASRESNI